VRTVPDQVALAHALIENIQREDLNPLEEAHGLQRLIDEFGLTHDAAAKAVGRCGAVSNILRLQELSKPIQEHLLAGQLDMGHARALLGLTPAQQVPASRVIARDCRCAPTSRVRWPTRKNAASARPAPRSNLARLQNDLAKLGAAVTIEPKGGAWRVVIRHSSLEQLDGILARLK
jgi:ParB family chromosome partitioning protein